jgi:hypothetical protein
LSDFGFLAEGSVVFVGVGEGTSVAVAVKVGASVVLTTGASTSTDGEVLLAVGTGCPFRSGPRTFPSINTKATSPTAIKPISTKMLDLDVISKLLDWVHHYQFPILQVTHSSHGI